jgi:multipile epidermal growth factor-like domains protein 8
MAGECGLVTSGSHLQCPSPCRLNTQCSKCLTKPMCGWCALGGLNGRGLCMEGGPGGPVAGICSDTSIQLYNESLPGEVI